VCPAHLQDKHFCSPIIDTEGQAKRLKEEEMTKEIEKVKKEYEEKQRRKKEREKASSKDNKDEKDKGKDELKDKDKDASESNANDEKDRDDKVRDFPRRRSISKVLSMNVLTDSPCQIASIQKGSGKETKSDDSPRIFSLHKYVISIIYMIVTPNGETGIFTRCASTGCAILKWRNAIRKD
jgi:hypothetical protein